MALRLTKREAMKMKPGEMRIIIPNRRKRCWRYYGLDWEYYDKTWYAILDTPYRSEIG